MSDNEKLAELQRRAIDLMDWITHHPFDPSNMLHKAELEGIQIEIKQISGI